jgi:hypothetical protein
MSRMSLPIVGNEGAPDYPIGTSLPPYTIDAFEGSRIAG